MAFHLLSIGADKTLAGLILLAAAGPATGQGASGLGSAGPGGAMVAPETIPAHCVDDDLDCHRLRMAQALRQTANTLLTASTPPDGGDPVAYMIGELRRTEPAALSALNPDAETLHALAALALRQAVQF